MGGTYQDSFSTPNPWSDACPFLLVTGCPGEGTFCLKLRFPGNEGGVVYVGSLSDQRRARGATVWQKSPGPVSLVREERKWQVPAARARRRRGSYPTLIKVYPALSRQPFAAPSV